MIGILGGTFDPIHFGHLRTALDVMQGVGLEQIRFVPLHGAVHRDQPETPSSLRLQMVQAAIEEQPGFIADDRELKRQGDSYSVDTLASLRGEFPQETLCLLMGMDAFNGFANWRQPEKILSLAHLIVMQRPGESVSQEPEIASLLSARRCQDPADLKAQKSGRILIHQVTQLEISSTRIRSMIAANESPGYLLPTPVLDLIRENRLYER
jgi:nicotinate-nucleotide adenylyltransferase